VVLEFDHVRGVKIWEISRMRVRASERALLSEIEKCDVRCANCHRRKTYREKDHLRRYGRSNGTKALALDPQRSLL